VAKPQKSGSVILVKSRLLSLAILFFGAALTKARVLASGKSVVPRAMAVRVREEIVEEPS
jgi:uncharacterized membrane protein YadS